ncbi:hypothetical protein FOCC_FOCC013524 [Frankliniella occidentalis]|nr:hypothetical protein FOCC_FOCC013524 [Frankliniella occidentalis]
MNFSDEEEYAADNPGDGDDGDRDRPGDGDDGDRDRPGTPVNKRRKRKELSSAEKKQLSEANSEKKFQSEWFNNKEWKGWLRPVPSNVHLAYCKACDKTIKCGKSEIQKHARGEGHEKKLKSMMKQPTLDAFGCVHAQKVKHEEAVKTAEIKIASFFVDNNIAFSTSDQLIAVQKEAFKDSKVAQDMTLSREKCNAIVRRVIGREETAEIVKDLQQNLFSIMVDESTDKGQDKNVCAVVYPKTQKPRTCLLELVRLDPRDCSAAKLWEATEQALARFEIPVTNILLHDGRVKQLYWTRLKEACPWALLLPCVCHSVAKVSEKACSMLPDFVQDHLRSVCSYLNGSPKRSKELLDFQEFYEEELNKIIKPSGTRWLVLHRCVAQYLKIQKSLLGFFELRVFEEKRDKTAANILNDLRNPYMLAYMHLPNYALNFTNQFNAIFQSKQVLIHKLAEKSETLMKNICQNFIKPVLLPRLGQVDYSRPTNQLPLREVYLGPGCREALDRIVPGAPRDPSVRPETMAEQLERDTDAFREKYLAFYARAAQEMKDRLPLNDPIFKEMAFIDPEVLLSRAARTGSDGLADLSLLTAKFKEKLQLDSNALATEWRNFPNEVNGRLREKLLGIDEHAMQCKIIFGQLRPTTMAATLDLIVSKVLFRKLYFSCHSDVTPVTKE